MRLVRVTAGKRATAIDKMLMDLTLINARIIVNALTGAPLNDKDAETNS